MGSLICSGNQTGHPALVFLSPWDLFIYSIHIFSSWGLTCCQSGRILHQFQALCVEAVPLPTGHGLQQSLLFLGAARGFQLVHSGQVEQDALVEIEGRVLLHQALQLTQGLL